MIRDVFAAVIAVLLLFLAMRLATTLKFYRRDRQRARDSERALGRTVIVEIPGEDDLVLFSEDAVRFYYGERSIDKDLIDGARLMINGNTIAAVRRVRAGAPPAEGGAGERPSVVVDDRVEGIARDRWDVAIEAVNGSLLVECGAIRERVSQELARAVFDAVRRDVERRGSGPDDPGRIAAPPHHSVSGTPAR
jgi:hypothetical protein